MGRVMPWMSASWKASVPIAGRATWPVIATTGTESMYASAIGVTRFVAPGPDVAMQTPTLPVAWAYPVAACPAPCSCRTRMCRTLESNSGSYAGRIAPPGMPNATSTPSASSDRTSEPAPEVGVGATAATAWVPAVAATVAGLARWARVSGVGGLVMAVQTFVEGDRPGLEQKKRPSCDQARDLARSPQ